MSRSSPFSRSLSLMALVTAALRSGNAANISQARAVAQAYRSRGKGKGSYSKVYRAGTNWQQRGMRQQREALRAHRRQQGGPGLTLSWGKWVPSNCAYPLESR